MFRGGSTGHLGLSESVLNGKPFLRSTVASVPAVRTQKKIARSFPRAAKIGDEHSPLHSCSAPWTPVELRNSVVSALAQRGWCVDELAVELDLDITSLVPVLRLLRLQEHIEADGRGRVRWAPVREQASPVPKGPEGRGRLMPGRRAACNFAAVALVGLLGACGGNAERPESKEPLARGETVKVRLSDMTINPANVVIAKPRETTLKVRNTGKAVHALRIDGPTSIVETVDLRRGESDEQSVDLSRPGRYRWYCPYHRKQGMTGTITVRE